MKKIKLITISAFFLSSLVLSQANSKDYNGWPEGEVKEMIKECVLVPDMNQKKCECAYSKISEIISFEALVSLNERVELDPSSITSEDMNLSMEVAAVMTECMLEDYPIQELSKDKQWTESQKGEAVQSCAEDMTGLPDPAQGYAICECMVLEISNRIDFTTFSSISDREPTDSEEDKRIQSIMMNAAFKCMKGMF